MIKSKETMDKSIFTQKLMPSVKTSYGFQGDIIPLEEAVYALTETNTESFNPHNRILCQQDLPKVLPFGKTKIQKLINEGQLPLVKVGKDYITTFNILEDWIKEHLGSEIYY